MAFQQQIEKLYRNKLGSGKGLPKARSECIVPRMYRAYIARNKHKERLT
ncbi:hypothetical protein FXV91_13365 [Methanosarcina sp. DH2]|jgi:hypothetical protein|nr:hypothetical protein [Methanosarcina sp. DH2]MCC4771116.1 hypothetical protein [Methanosarcina sp. DH2]